MVETSRGRITLGAQLTGGHFRDGVDNLRDCISQCASLGNGVALMPSLISTTPQLCFGVDFNFADHTCYFHTNIETCGGNDSADEFPVTPVNTIANPNTVNVLICKLLFSFFICVSQNTLKKTSGLVWAVVCRKSHSP